MRMCDAFGVPLVVVVDVPGYLPGVGQEWDGVVRRGAKLLHAFAEAVVPRVTVVTRKAYGGAYIAMNSRALGATKVFAWPDAQVAVMGAVAAVRILHRRKLAEVPEDARAQVEHELADEHERSPAASTGPSRSASSTRSSRRADPRSALARALADALAADPRHPRPPRQHPAVAAAAPRLLGGAALRCWTVAPPPARQRPPDRRSGGSLLLPSGRRDVGSGRSHHLVQPADGRALARGAEGLELGVPGAAEQDLDLVLDRLADLERPGDGRADAVLARA